MGRKTLITVTEHAMLCITSYLDWLKGNMSDSDYVITINSHTDLAIDRLYRQNNPSTDEYMKAKSQVTLTHSKYLKSITTVQRGR